MAIPDFQTVMLPLLKEFKKRGNLTSPEAISYSIKYFKLTPEEIETLLPSKTQRVIYNRVYWSLVYLQRAGLISKIKRGHYQITNEADSVLSDKIDRLTVKYLRRFPSFVEFQNLSKNKADEVTDEITESSIEVDPFEQFEQKYNHLKIETLKQIIGSVRKLEPEDFEKICLMLMQKIGYGNKIQHTGKTGDGGKDGKVLVDALGLDTILLQSKRYKEGSPVSESHIRDFIGTLNIHKANKGVVITASHFAPTCSKIIKEVSFNIVLIDGEKLAELLFDYEIGVKAKSKYIIKEIDQEFFDGISEEFLRIE